MTAHNTLLDVCELRVQFSDRRGRPIRAVDGVDLEILPGETVGLVGESGSGKSTLGNAILGLVPPAGGRIRFGGRDITYASPRHRRALAEHLQVVFQDPYSSLNPSRSIGATVAEPLRGRGLSRAAAMARAVAVLEQVGLPGDAATRYPGQFSGGQRQRIAIARALVLKPELVICDEPTSALDLSVQAQVLNLLLELQEQLGLAYLFISHDIDVISHLAHRVAVMYHGRIVEHGPVERVIETPEHPYTRALLSATPARHGQQLVATRPAGQVSLSAPGQGCPFVDRCPDRVGVCASVPPPLVALDGDGQRSGAVACHLASTSPVAGTGLSAAS